MLDLVLMPEPPLDHKRIVDTLALFPQDENSSFSNPPPRGNDAHVSKNLQLLIRPSSYADMCISAHMYHSNQFVPQFVGDFIKITRDDCLSVVQLCNNRITSVKNVYQELPDGTNFLHMEWRILWKKNALSMGIPDRHWCRRGQVSSVLYDLVPTRHRTSKGSSAASKCMWFLPIQEVNESLCGTV